MTTRPAAAADLADLEDLDGTIESTEYAHIDFAAADGVTHWKLDWRPAREKIIQSNALGDDALFLLRQALAGHDEAVVSTAEHDGRPVALLLAQADRTLGVMSVLDLRVDYDARRQGIATVMLYQLIEAARDADLRAARIVTRANNAPAARLLDKLGWELSGLDTKRHNNHDLVKESATLIWYYVIK